MSSRLILADSTTEERLHLLNRNIFRILFVAQIFHLEIYEEIFIDMLIDILISLIYLNSLNISSLSLLHTKDLFNDTENDYSFVINNNQITKVYL